MSNQVKNAETKLVTDSQVAAAQVGAVKPSAVVKASAKQAQDKANKALAAEALAKKKALEEEAKLAEERAAQEESEAQAAAEEVSSESVAHATSAESDEASAKADASAAEEIEAVAKQLDDSAAGQDLAARDLGMMFAQAGSSASAAPALLGGISTEALIAGVVIVGAAAASGGGSSSSPPPAVTPTPNLDPANTVEDAFELALGLTTSSFIADPSSITVPTLGTPAAVASLTSIAESVTASGTALTDSNLTWGTINSKGNLYTGTSGADLIVISSSDASVAKTAESIADHEIANAGAGYTAGSYTGIALTGGSGTGALATVVVDANGEITSVTITAAGKGYEAGDVLAIGGALAAQGPTTSGTVEVTEIVPFVGTRIDGAGGNDVVRLNLTANVTADESDGTDNTPGNIYLANVEAVQVVATGARTVDVTNFGAVQELWNWGTATGANSVSFDEMSSASVKVGMYNTTTTTSVVYGEIGRAHV